MCIYCGTTNYRAIYKNHCGPIPKEDDGRTYHIHHIDGNHSNNDPANLLAVTIKEHYDIHYQQGDWVACHRLAAILKLTAEEVSELAKKNVKKQIESGTHPWLGGMIQKETARKRLEQRTHQFLDSEWKSKNNKRRVEERTHNFIGSGNNKKMLEQGKHPSQQPHVRSTLSIVQKEYNRTRVEKGEHPFQKLNSFIWKCECCGKIGKNKSNYDRHVNSKACKRQIKINLDNRV